MSSHSARWEYCQTIRKNDFADILENFLTAGHLIALSGCRAYSHSEKRKPKPQQGQFLCTTTFLGEGRATNQSQEIPWIKAVSSAVALRGAYLLSKTMGFFDIADLFLSRLAASARTSSPKKIEHGIQASRRVWVVPAAKQIIRLLLDLIKPQHRLCLLGHSSHIFW